MHRQILKSKSYSIYEMEVHEWGRRTRTTSLFSQSHKQNNLIGTLFSPPGYMNVTMREVRLVDASRRSQRFDHFFVQNRLVRLVQIPSEVDVKRELRRMYDPEFKQSQRGRGALGFIFGLNFVFLLVQKLCVSKCCPVLSDSRPRQRNSIAIFPLSYLCSAPFPMRVLQIIFFCVLAKPSGNRKAGVDVMVVVAGFEKCGDPQ